MSLCLCGSNTPADACCGPILAGDVKSPTAEALMRARYCAFAGVNVAFLNESLHPEHRADHDEAATRHWAESSEWLGLEIVATEQGEAGDQTGVVEFIATFKEKGVTRHHHERSTFSKVQNQWYFVDGQMVLPTTQINEGPKVGRNDPCPCGSGKKYKKCCGG
jgi:SEC-C motif-containing protein